MGLALAFGCLTIAAVGARADEFTPAQKEELGAFIKDYLVKNPDVLRAAIEALDKHDKDVAEAQRKKAVGDASGPLFSSKYQATVGNPKGTATLVEFFDYNCHYCKGALPDITRLMKDDPNLKLVLKDFPVLGPGSVEAARVATAARNQLPGDKFWAFHTKLLAMHGPIGKPEALSVARELGLDMDKLAKDMENPASRGRSARSDGPWPTRSRSMARRASWWATKWSWARSPTTSSRASSIPCTSAATRSANETRITLSARGVRALSRPGSFSLASRFQH